MKSMKRRFSLLHVLVVLSSLVYSDILAEEDTSTHVGGEEESSEVEEIAKEISTFSEFFSTESSSAYEGVLLGNIISIDSKKRFIFFKPKERSLSKVIIYLDKATRYTSINTGKRRKAKVKDLIDGHRAAVRVFIKHGVVLADEVFLVTGEFETRTRYRKLRYTRPQGEERAGEKAAGADAPAAHH